MLRLSYVLFRWAAALGHRVPRRLTKAGLLAATGMVLAGAVGSDLDQSVAFQAFALLFCLLLLAMSWAPFFRGQFRIVRFLPRLATVEQPFRYRVEVHNGSARGYRGLELLEDLADPCPSFDEFAQRLYPPGRMRPFRLAPSAESRLDFRRAIARPVSLPDLGPHGAAEAELEVVPLRRGPLRFQGATVAQRDPLGLFRGWVRLRLPHTVLIVPKRYPVPPLAFLGTRHYQPGGVALASAIGESEEFVSMREYRPGDPVRRIHWRSWARVGRPIVKEYQDEFFVRHGLVLDTLAGWSHAEAFEEAVSVAASFACTLDTQESLLDLLFVGGQAFCLTAGRGLGGSEQFLEILASVRPNPGQRFEALRDLVLRHAPRLATCIFVFADWDEPRRDLVQRLRILGLPVLALVVADRVTARLLEQGPNLGNPDGVHALRLGRIAEGLEELRGMVP